MRTPRKLTALVLMGALTASSVAAVPASAKTFSDVPSTHWAYTVIDEISNETIMVGVGDGLFSPESKLTRAEFSAILSNLAPDKSNGRFEVTYTDVPADAWYADAAEWAVSNGLVEVKNGKFNPNEAITREQMADMTYKYTYYNFVSQIINNSTNFGYADQDQISDEYEKAVNVLSNNGLLAGRGDNKFEPKGTLTRAEAAAMASRLLDVAEKAAAENPGEDPGEDPEQPPVEEPDNPGEDNPGEDNPSVDPDEPEQPPVDEPSDPDEEQPPAEDPSEDPNDPANWDLDGAPKWFLVGQPDNITDDQWEQLITYYADKECPENSNYPSSIKELPAHYQNNEELAKKYCGARMVRLYDLMQQDLADQALAADGEADITTEEKKMINLVNEARKDAGESELIVSPALCRAADIRAKEGAQLFSHTRPNGQDCTSVIEMEDIDLAFYKFDGESTSTVYAENIAYRKSSQTYTAKDAMEDFCDSSLHNQNLLASHHKYIGVASYTSGNKTVWVQCFGRTQ